MIVSEETDLTQTLALLPHPLFLGEFLDVLIEQFELY